MVDIYIIVGQILVNIGIWYYILYFTNEKSEKEKRGNIMSGIGGWIL